MTYKLRSVEEIKAAMYGISDPEALVNFMAGVLLGKNRVQFVVGSAEEYMFYKDMYHLLIVASYRLVEITGDRFPTVPEGVEDEYDTRDATRIDHE